MSAAENKAIPDDLKDAGSAVYGYLQIAQAIERKRYPESVSPAGLLPALVAAIAVHHSATLAADRIAKALGQIELSIPDNDDIERALEKIESTLNDLPERMGLGEMSAGLAGIEQELHVIAERFRGLEMRKAL